MILLSVVIAYLVLRWWGAAQPLHRDDWFYRWCEWLAVQTALSQSPVGVLVLSILGPVVLVLIALAVLGSAWYWLQLLVAVPVLLYSLGRGKYSGVVTRYLRARELGDWVAGLACYQSLVSPSQAPAELPDQDDWAALDRYALVAVVYRGFERSFAVLFWFILLGPAGALTYRLSALYPRNNPELVPSRQQAHQWLWLLEWPAARLLGLSFAMTGNFVGCIQALRHNWASEEPTADLLVHYVLGALSVNEVEPETAELIQPEFTAILALFSRTLIFWVSVLAVVSVLA